MKTTTKIKTIGLLALMIIGQTSYGQTDKDETLKKDT